MFCTKCGKELNSGDRFCANCGAEVKANEPQRHRYEDVVFNPPFRAEAERRTAEIVKGREEYRGFSDYKKEEPKIEKPRERMNINWNLDGLPDLETKRTEEASFDWSEVIEKKSSPRSDTDTAEFEPVRTDIGYGIEGSAKPAEPNIEKQSREERAEKILDSLLGAGAGREYLREQYEEPRVEQININGADADGEGILTLEELENELFGSANERNASGTQTVRYEPLKAASIDRNKDLDDYLSAVNSDLMAGRMQAGGTMEQGYREEAEQPRSRRSRRREEPWHIPEEPKEAQDNKAVDEIYGRDARFMPSMDRFGAGAIEEQPHIPEILGAGVREGLHEPEVAKSAEAVSEFEGILGDVGEVSEVAEPTFEVPPVRGDEILPDKEPNGELSDINGELEGSREEDVQAEILEEQSEGSCLYDELFTEPEIPKEERKDLKFYTFTRNNDAFQELLRRERERLEKMGADYVPQNKAACNARGSKIITPKLCYVGTANPAVTMAIDATGEKDFIIGGTISTGEAGSPHIPFGGGQDRNMPKGAEGRNGASSARGNSNYGIGRSEDMPDEKAQQLKDFFDESSTEEPAHRHIFGNIIMILLILIILTGGAYVVAKHFVPENKYVKYGDMAVEKVMNMIGMNSEADEPSIDEELDQEDPVDANVVHFEEIVASQSIGLDTIGEVLYTDDSLLKYSALGTFAYPETETAAEFVDSEWIPSGEGAAVTYAEGMVANIIAYYDGWKSANKDKSLVGINKVEIGDFKLIDDAGFVLARISFAGKDGTEIVKVQTVKLSIGETEMNVDTVKEEILSE